MHLSFQGQGSMAVLFGAPPGSLGLTNSAQSGWMTGPSFATVLEHEEVHTVFWRRLYYSAYRQWTKALNTILHARENGIVSFSFFPH
jgi:hypothetical protein